MEQLIKRKFTGCFFVFIFFLFGNIYTQGQDPVTGLTVIDYKVSPDESIDTLIVTFLIKTEQPLYNSNFVFYLVKDSSNSGELNSSSYVGNVLIDSVKNDTTISHKITLSQKFSPGNYYLVTTNYFATYEQENKITYGKAPFKVLPSTLDLYCQSFYVDYNELNPGYVNRMRYTIRKRGNLLVTSVPLDFYLSTDLNFNSTEDIYLGNHNPELSFSYDQEFVRDSISIPATVPEGQYHLYCILDPGEIWEETNEINNVIVIPVRVKAPQIDLKINNVYYNEVNDTTSRVGIHFENYGSSNVMLDHTTAYYLSRDTLLDPVTDLFLGTILHIDSLPHTTTTYTTFNTPKGFIAGDYYLIFIADYLNEIPETDKSNNLTITQISSDVDLTLISPYDPDPIITHNYLTPVSVIVKNNGTLTSKKSSINYGVINEIIDNMFEYITIEVDTLLPGEEREIKFDIEMPLEAVYYVKMRVDADNILFEENETNNYLAQKVVYYKITANEQGTTSRINISPIPAQEDFTISTYGISSPLHYSVLNILGEVVWTEVDNNNINTKVNCNDWAKGIYILKAEYEGKIFQEKFLIH